MRHNQIRDSHLLTFVNSCRCLSSKDVAKNVCGGDHPPARNGGRPVALDCSYAARFPVNAAGEAYGQLSLAGLCLLRVHWRTAGGSAFGTAETTGHVDERALIPPRLTQIVNGLKRPDMADVRTVIRSIVWGSWFV